MNILISRCYSEVTPESSKQGDISDSGFVYQSQSFSFRELVDEILRSGFTNESGAEWLSTGYQMEDYTTGTEREESLHLDRANPPRAERYWLAAIRYCEAKLKARRQSIRL